ncbi:hypothetical protein BKA65DRAFT_600287 [Rhexocercosporidium sp. MPI-PUGE-AT-0058]|nr:hypothetical protein BKA65DRAFT_600287 [Rhexocercosporidium sp. MPI-PUGE-AT-0058]
MTTPSCQALTSTIACADQTRLKYFDNRSISNDDSWLGEDEIIAKLASLDCLVETPATGTPTPQPSSSPKQAPLVLITTTGDGVTSTSGTDALGVSRSVLAKLIQACGFPRQLTTIYLLRHPHLSRHVHYAEDEITPAAVLCLLSSRNEDLALDLHARCIAKASTLALYPAHILTIILARLVETNTEWLYKIWDAVDRVENATGMHPTSWARQVPNNLRRGDYSSILQELHALNVELCLAHTVMAFANQLGAFCSETLITVNSLEQVAGYLPLKAGQMSNLTEQNEYNHEVCRNSREKLKELLSRVQSQINVTFSLIAQRDSSVSLFLAGSSTSIARLAAQDSRSMKTITIITLVFLPLNLVTTIWSASIFTLDTDSNWKVYVGCSIAFSAVVFAAWFLYNKEAGKRQRKNMDESIWLHIPGVGNVRDGKVQVDGLAT